MLAYSIARHDNVANGEASVYKWRPFLDFDEWCWLIHAALQNDAIFEATTFLALLEFDKFDPLMAFSVYSDAASIRCCFYVFKDKRRHCHQPDDGLERDLPLDPSSFGLA